VIAARGPGGQRGMARAVAPIGLVLLLSLTPLGCVPAHAEASGREALRQALLTRYERELRLDPAAVAEKLRRMAKGNFAFFRGSLGLYPTAPSRFARPAPAQATAVIGDPHPENIGTFVTADAQTVVDFNDFDQAGFGWFIEDLRRLALGLYLAGDAADVAKKQRARQVDAAVEGYVAELRGLSAGAAPVALRADSAFGGDLASILAPPPAPLGEGTAALPAGEAKQIEVALLRARTTLWKPERFAPGFFAVKRAARAHGGIASFLLERIRVEVEGPGPGDDDDVVLELKETPAGQAAALVKLQRELQERPDEDPLLGHTNYAGKSFRTRSFGADRRSVSVERLAREVKGPRWGKKDLRQFGQQVGRLLGRGHARARAADGRPGLASLLPLVGDGTELAAETVAVTAAEAARLERDVDDLRVLLAELGPTLGWKPKADPARAATH
jgi:hypothetical protein